MTNVLKDVGNGIGNLNDISRNLLIDETYVNHLHLASNNFTLHEYNQNSPPPISTFFLVC